ncbi:MAG: HD domain-containing protein [Eubacteriales bacterium]|nr:HD domain-containing protein [Eubacteriales bacterium]
MKLSIDREQVKASFAKYVDKYDVEDEKILLKIKHTYRVAQICEKIARGLGLSDYDVDLAWLIGMLHDIGRFEQLRQYGTFVDADSIDHAHFAVKLLFDDGLIQEYVEEASAGNAVIATEHDTVCRDAQRGDMYSGDLYLINRAIWNHSAYRIEEGLDERILLFSKIIRDADKVDIFKVAYDTPLETLFGFSREDIQQATVSPEVMQAYREEHAILRGLKKTPVDFLTGHIALAFELEFAASRQVMQEQGYLQKLLSFQSDNPITRQQFDEMRERMEAYLTKAADIPTVNQDGMMRVWY